MQTTFTHFSHKSAFALYCLVIMVIFLPVLLNGEVICPFNNDSVLGMTPSVQAASNIENSRFSDFNYTFIPEINQNLHGNHRNWISTWSPWSELGRPTFQNFALGKAYLLTNLLSHVTDNPFLFDTYYAILLVFLSGIFLYLFLYEIGLSPVSCIVAAIGLATCTLWIYWIAFNVFLSIVCWTAALLWLIARCTKKLSFWNWFALVFASYSLLMTAYPQSVIHSLYLLAGYSLYRVSSLSIKASRKVIMIIVLGLAGITGLTMALPVYLDILLAAKSSARMSIADSFFTAVLYPIKSISDLGSFFALIFDPYFFGNPIAPGFPLKSYGGFSLTPVYFSLLVLSFFIGLKQKLWGWHLFIVLCAVATVSPSFYLILVHYFGFNLSRFQLLGGAIIPIFVVIAYQIEELLKGKISYRLSKGQLFTLFTALAVIATWTVAGAGGNMAGTFFQEHFNIFRVVLASCLLGGFAAFVLTRQPVILLLLTVFTAISYGKPLLLTRPLSGIHTSSSLVERLNSSLKKGERYAFAEQTGLLPPNMESLVHLRSVHTYNSLTSIGYQQYIASLGGETTFYGRQAKSIGKDLTSRPAFSYSGIGLILSRSPLEDPGLRQIGEESGLRLYKPLRDPVLYAQVNTYARDDNGKYSLSGYLFDHPALSVSRVEEYDDYQKFAVTPNTADTLLFISQQYHPKWRAMTDLGPSRTVAVNNFFLGVAVPAGAKWVELEFRPFVYWSFIPQIVFLGAFLLFVGQAFSLRLRARKNMRLS